MIGQPQDGVEQCLAAPAANLAFGAMSAYLGGTAFPGKAYEIHLTDQQLKTLKTIPGRAAASTKKIVEDAVPVEAPTSEPAPAPGS